MNNAGTIRRHPAVEFPVEDWDLVLETNLDAVFLLCRHFGAGKIEQRSGKIIDIASLLSFTGGITVPAYAAGKHAVAGLTKGLANERAEHNVQVNAIAPGFFAPRIHRRFRIIRNAQNPSPTAFQPEDGENLQTSVEPLP